MKLNNNKGRKENMENWVKEVKVVLGEKVMKAFTSMKLFFQA